MGSLKIGLWAKVGFHLDNLFIDTTATISKSLKCQETERSLNLVSSKSKVALVTK